MFDLPPDPPAFDTDPVIERLVECGLNADGITIVHHEEHYYSEITFSESAAVREDHFDCIRQALRGEFPIFEDPELMQRYDAYLADYYRPQRLAESRATLSEFGLLEDFPSRENFDSFGDYLRALERHAGVAEGEWLSADGEIVTFQPPEGFVGQHGTGEYERAVRLLSVINYAAVLGDVPNFGFVGNERVAED